MVVGGSAGAGRVLPPYPVRSTNCTLRWVGKGLPTLDATSPALNAEPWPTISGESAPSPHPGAERFSHNFRPEVLR